MINIKKKFRIVINKIDILNGLRQDCYLCPIALALKRKLRNKCEELIVSHDNLEFDLIHRNIFFTYVAKLPLKAQNFIKEFDYIGYAKPFSFEVKLKRISS